MPAWARPARSRAKTIQCADLRERVTGSCFGFAQLRRRCHRFVRSLGKVVFSDSAMDPFAFLASLSRLHPAASARQTVESLRVAVRLAPTNGMAFARLAMRLFNRQIATRASLGNSEYARHAGDFYKRQKCGSRAPRCWNVTAGWQSPECDRSSKPVPAATSRDLNAQGILLQRTNAGMKPSDLFKGD